PSQYCRRMRAVAATILFVVLVAAPAGSAARRQERDAIAYVRASCCRAQVYLINADGSANRQVTKNLRRPPEGAYTHGRSPNGSGLRALTREVGAGDPAWSPDGRQIAFARQKPAGIYVMNADGSARRRVTTGPSDRQPDWSPDGTQILFVRQLRGPNAEIFV